MLNERLAFNSTASESKQFKRDPIAARHWPDSHTNIPVEHRSNLRPQPRPNWLPREQKASPIFLAVLRQRLYCVALTASTVLAAAQGSSGAAPQRVGYSQVWCLWSPAVHFPLTEGRSAFSLHVQRASTGNPHSALTQNDSRYFYLHTRNGALGFAHVASSCKQKLPINFNRVLTYTNVI